MTRVALLDYGMGNLHSAAKALECVAPDAKVEVTADPAVVKQCDRVVFPGVGAIRDCMAEIRRLHLDEIVHDAVRSKPVLGICVGMQAMFSFSEENNGVECLDVFPGRVQFFGEHLKDASGAVLKVPHMGWNQVTQVVKHPLWKGIADESRFYFVHSYYVSGAHECTAGKAVYGVDIAAAVARDNVFAVQFHPEKSAATGLKLLENFMRWDGAV